jgi:hypothetical protein
MPAVLREDTPQVARTVKGQIRIQMERCLQQSGVRSIVILAGDFFGSGKGTWFDMAMVKDIRKGRFTYPGAPEVSRAWAYLQTWCARLSPLRSGVLPCPHTPLPKAVQATMVELGLIAPAAPRGVQAEPQRAALAQ